MKIIDILTATTPFNYTLIAVDQDLTDVISMDMYAIIDGKRYKCFYGQGATNSVMINETVHPVNMEIEIKINK